MARTPQLQGNVGPGIHRAAGVLKPRGVGLISHVQAQLRRAAHSGRIILRLQLPIVAKAGSYCAAAGHTHSSHAATAIKSRHAIDRKHRAVAGDIHLQNVISQCLKKTWETCVQKPTISSRPTGEETTCHRFLLYRPPSNYIKKTGPGHCGSKKGKPAPRPVVSSIRRRFSFHETIPAVRYPWPENQYSSSLNRKSSLVG